MIRIAVALALMCTQALAAAPRNGPAVELKDGVYEVNSDWGGGLLAYSNRFREIEKTGLVVKVKGKCASACTLVLRNPKACAGPKSVFGFHRASDPEPQEADRATRKMWSEYPTLVREKVGELTPDMVYLKGTDLLPECK